MVGSTISHYRIVDKLGEGGMGVVYKAEDTKLERTVALKFLAAHLLNDDEAKQRFLREAKSAAALHHPNICTVHEIDEAEGKTFLAMAFLEGETLEDRIAKGPLPLKDALDIGRQVAEGLQAAHSAGVVHRDIKPANILVSPEGRATVMDFGLARLTEASKLTKADQTVGTAAYMSPEQLQGGDVDHRTDIWALGCVFYEMVAGVRPFPGEYAQALAFEIVNQEPEPLTSIRAGVPMELEFIVGKCLAKDVSDRYESASELARDLRTLAEKLKSGRSTILATTNLNAGVPATLSAAQALNSLPSGALFVPRRSLRLSQLTAGALGLALLGLLAIHLTEAPPPERPVRRFSFAPEGLDGNIQAAAISPDGNYLAYRAHTGTRVSLRLRPLASDTSREVPGTDGVVRFFWSPDGKELGFLVRTDDRKNLELKRVPIDGGSPIKLCELAAERLGGGTWSPDGERIVFSSGLGLYDIPARGGQPQLLFDPSGDPRPFPVDPQFLPDGDGPPALVYAAMASLNDRWLAVLNLETGERRELRPGVTPVYSSEGYLIHGPPNWVGAGLFALPFSRATLEPTGEHFPITVGGAGPSLSQDGVLTYSDTENPAFTLKTLVWRSRAGEVLETVGQPQVGLREFALSPDRRWVATTVDEPADIWIQDLTRSTTTRSTFDPLGEYMPSWSPSGQEVVYSMLRGTGAGAHLMKKNVNGSDEAGVLVETRFSASGADWSSDGRYVVFSGPTGEKTGDDIQYVDLNNGTQPFESKTFLSTPAREQVPKLSPDGRFLAYVSDESGRNEILVRPFPSGEGRWQASVSGGTQPLWRSDGKELFYVDAGYLLMAVPITAGGSLALGQPQPLFESADLIFRRNAWPQYDVSADGQRFLTSTPVQDESAPARSIHFTLNWYEEFRDREQD